MPAKESRKQIVFLPLPLMSYGCPLDGAYEFSCLHKLELYYLPFVELPDCDRDFRYVILVIHISTQ